MAVDIQDHGRFRDANGVNKMNIPDVVNLGQKWIVGEQLDAGGFAKVYRAQSEDGDPAVVKLIPKAPGAQRELLFEELDDVPNIVPVIETGEWSDYWVLVMPHADQSLWDYLKERGGRLGIADAVTVLTDVATALVALERRVVHRDIKPKNILRLYGRWCLADFGIARYAEATTAPDTMKFAKTPAYAAPEQWREETAVSATDVYALGVVAYELLTGEHPFTGPDYRRQHLEDSVRPVSGIPTRLQSLVEECLYKAAQARPSPKNLLARLQASTHLTSPAASRLQAVNALAVRGKAEEERQLSAARVEQERRSGLYEVADLALERLYQSVDNQIRVNASLVRPSTSPIGKEWRLNGAILTLGHIMQPTTPSPGTSAPFEIIAYAKIGVEVPPGRDGYAGRFHSLWYCDAQDEGVFRWFETAFMAYPSIIGSGRIVPSALKPDHGAFLALKDAARDCRVVWPFTPIDQGHENDFIERWIEWFADAAQGRLYLPERIPELEPKGSWRIGG